MFCLLTCARNRVGLYAQDSFWRKGLSTHLLFVNRARGIFHFYDQVAALFGGAVPSYRDAAAELGSRLGGGPVPRDPGRGAVVGVAPCCSELSRERMLDVGQWLEILRRRLDEGQVPAVIRLLGGPADRPFTRALAAGLASAMPQVRVEDLAGTGGLMDSVRRLRELDEFIGIDSALLHYARLLGVPTTSFWGPTDPSTLLRPSDLAPDTTHYSRLPCSPCVHIAAIAPCKGRNICMEASLDPSGAGRANPPWLA